MPSPFRIPKVQLLAALILIYLTSVKIVPFRESFTTLLIPVFFTVFFDLLCSLLRKKKIVIPYAALGTGLIIGLIIDPQASWYQVAGISGIAAGTKHFLRISGKHVFNPAAIGLLAGGILFKQYVTWWGVSFQSLTPLTILNVLLFLILLLPILISGYRLRRFQGILVFLLAHAVFSHVLTSSFSLQSLFLKMFDPTTVFFAVVMLPEPMTSPVTPKRQVLFGLTVTLLTLTLSHPSIVQPLAASHLLPDLFIAALLVGNLLFFRFR